MTGKRFIFGPQGEERSKRRSIRPRRSRYRRGLSGIPVRARSERAHRRSSWSLPEDHRDVRQTRRRKQLQVYSTATRKTPNEERYVTRHSSSLQHVSADDAANVLGKFKSKDARSSRSTAAGNSAHHDGHRNEHPADDLSLLEEIDVGGAGDQMFIEPIHYASATDIANRVNELFDLKGGGSGGAAAAGSRWKGSSSALARSSLLVEISTSRSSSLTIAPTRLVIVSEPSARTCACWSSSSASTFRRAAKVKSTSFALQHADATDLTKTLNEIISTAQTPLGAAPTVRRSSRPRQWSCRLALRRAASSKVDLKVSADKATNAIVVTSSQRDYASLRLVVDKLDQPRRQVFIEAVIMDLQLKRSNSIRCQLPRSRQISRTARPAMVSSTAVTRS